MTTNFKRQPFSKSNLAEIMSFAQTNQLAPFYNSSLIKRFLTDLVSSENLVFDIFYNQERVAVAALLDRTKNGANTANLEIIGLQAESNINELFTMLLNLSKESLPANRDAVDISYYESFPISPSLFVVNEFEPSYSIYDMVMTKPQLGSKQIELPFTFSKLQEDDFEEYHSIVMNAFEKNEEANISPLEEMRTYLFKAVIPPTVLLKDKRIIGFLDLKIDEREPESGEINTIGLLPEFRGMGLGKLLFKEAICQMSDYGVKKFSLSVSANNENALHLYQQFGFVVQEKSSVYRWKRKPIEDTGIKK